MANVDLKGLGAVCELLAYVLKRLLPHRVDALFFFLPESLFPLRVFGIQALIHEPK